MKRFGGPFSHPFLIVENERGEVVEEIHGRWQNTIRTRQFISLEEQYDDKTRTLPLPALHPMAVVSPCSPRDAHKAIVRQPYMTAPQEEIENLMVALKAVVADLNEERHPFYRYAETNSGFANCQMILGEAIARTPGFPPVPPLKLAHTGWTLKDKDAINRTHEYV